MSTEEPSATPTGTQLDLTVVKSGFSKWKGKYDSGPQLGYGVLVKNPNMGWIADSVDISIAFLAGDGSVIDTDEETIAAILPGQTIAWADTKSDFEADWSDMKSMEVTIGEPSWEDGSGTYGSFSFSKVTMRRDTLGDITVTARLGSTFEKALESPQAVAVFYKGSAIVGGGYTYLENSKNGAAVKVSTSFAGRADRVELFGFVTSLSLI